MRDKELLKTYLRVSTRPVAPTRPDQTAAIWLVAVVVPIALTGLVGGLCALVSGTPWLLAVAFPLGGYISGLVATSPTIGELVPSLRGYRTSLIIGLVICFEAMSELLEAALLPTDEHAWLFRIALALLFLLGLLLVVLPAFIRRQLASPR